MDEHLTAALREENLTMTVRRWLPGDPDPLGDEETVAVEAIDRPVLAWSDERIEPAMIDYHSRPGRVVVLWLPYLLLLAALAAAAVVLSADNASDSGGRSGPSAVPVAPAPRSLTTVAPAPAPVPPPAPPDTTAAPAVPVEPAPRAPTADAAFLSALGADGWPLESLDVDELTVQGRSVCAILVGPPALDESAAAAVISARYGTSAYRAAQFVEAAHEAYCVTGVIA